MQVRQRLIIIAVALAMAAVLIVGVLFQAVYRVDRARRESEISNDLLVGVLERAALRSDYLRNNHERAKEQWLAKHHQIGGLLRLAAEQFRDPENRRTIDELLKLHGSITKIFAAIVANREKPKMDADSPSLAEETEDRLVSQLNMRLYQVVLEGHKLHEASGAALSASLRLAVWGISLTLAVLFAGVIFNSWTMGRTITDRVRRLRDGAARIGGGDLEHRIDLPGNDEFAEVSAAFNAMTAKLAGSYREMEDEIEERKRAEANTLQLSQDLAVRNRDLEALNQELEAFIYSVSHDLRAPLRTMAAFVSFLFEDCADRLDDQAKEHLTRIGQGSARMSRLIEDLLALSRWSRQAVKRIEVDLSELAAGIVAGLRAAEPGRRVEVDIESGLSASADPALIEIVLTNLLGNAWKFTARTAKARIEFGAGDRDGQTVYFVRDNGVGFDPQFAAKMFQPFERLPGGEDFEGTGIGLAIVERLVRRHGGRAWAEGEIGQGATVYFTLG